ncbi:hypothetical protein [Halobaculum lipolyticum]|uniref:DUF5658 domain-containing protein n=1 Tax=Halobaculum lipolyticum TaxID=3032001 RepID=A0ABD5WBA3_9EURY|nr:hypothetical protein [Halobaculum sp. DT31]
MDRSAPPTASALDGTGADGESVGDAAAAGTGSATVAGLAGLAVTKAADVATTVVGLRATAGVRELNPVADAAISSFGLVPGLVALGVATVAAIGCVVEGAFAYPARTTGGAAALAAGRVGRTGRLLCYGVGCACNAAFAVHNAVLIAGVGAV